MNGRLKIIIQDIGTGEYYNGSFTNDIKEAIIYDYEEGYKILKELRKEGRKVTYIEVKEKGETDRRLKHLNAVKSAVKREIRHKYELVRYVERKCTKKK